MSASAQNQGCIAALLHLVGIDLSPKESVDSLPYRASDHFLSPAEVSFYHALVSAVGDDATICPKIRLADLIYVTRPNEHQAARNRIAQKHLDFLLCEPSSMRPMLGIELDDASHGRADRQDRDGFVNAVFDAARLPLLHVKAQASYNSTELSQQLAKYLQPAAEPPQAFFSNPESTPPICPKCGVPMVLRTASRGVHQGEQFFGCTNYPRCQERVEII